MATSNPRFVFGIEIECITHFYLPTASWPLPNTPDKQLRPLYTAVQERLRQGLLSAGIPVNAAPVPKASPSPARFANWTIERDHSVVAVQVNSPPFWRCGTEMVSPVLPFNGLSYRSIELALNALRVSTSGLYVNDTCAFHVHIGLEDNSNLPFATAKCVALVVVALQDVIEQLLDRSVVLSLPFVIFARPPSQLRLFKETFPAPADRAMAVAQMDSYKELVGLMNPPLEGGEGRYTAPNRRYTAYQFTGLEEGLVLKGHSKKPTLEFRQHQATVNAADVVAWVKFLKALLEWCHRASDEEVEALVGMTVPTEDEEDKVSQGLFGVRELLQVFGVEAEVVEYYTGKDFTVKPDQEPEEDEDLWIRSMQS